jgi:hypothetical protein
MVTLLGYQVRISVNSFLLSAILWRRRFLLRFSRLEAGMNEFS